MASSRILLLICLAFTLSESFSQLSTKKISYSKKSVTTIDSTQKVAWLKQNAINIRSVDPADEEFSDLKPLKNIIGNSQVVMIGEPNHHVGTIYLAKTRLIKFLHQQMGFDLLTFESGMYDAAKAWKEIKAGNDSRQAFRNAIFFGGREEYKPLINYLKQSSNSVNPLELAGFDSQMMGRYSRDSLFVELRRFFKIIGYVSSNLDDSSFFAKELAKANAYNGYKAPDKTVYDTLGILIKQIDSLASHPFDFETGFYYQLLKSMKRDAQRVQLDNILWTMSGVDNERLAELSSSMRDEQMADNLLWYVKQFPNRKIIVIAHNDHLAMAYPGDITKEPWNFEPDAPAAPKLRWDQNYMGYIIKDSLKENVFNIAITGNKGELGWINHIDSSKTLRVSIEKNVKAGVLENFLDAAGFQQAFINLKNPPKGGEWLKGRIRVRYTAGPGSETEWHKAADAIFYIRNFSPTNIKD